MWQKVHEPPCWSHFLYEHLFASEVVTVEMPFRTYFSVKHKMSRLSGFEQLSIKK